MLAEHHLNLNDAAFIADPYPALASVREAHAAFLDEGWNKVFFTRYEHIAQLLKDRRLGRATPQVLSGQERSRSASDARLEDFYRFQDNVFMDWEVPDHTRIRSLVTQVFTPRRVESLRPRLVATAHRLIDGVSGRGSCDFVSSIAEPLPVIMIAALLGIPESDIHMLRPWSAAIVKMYELGYTEEQAKSAARAAHEFMEYVGALAAARRTHPQDDLISGLVEVQAAGGKLGEDELRATCIFLLNAGHEATVNGSSLGLLALFRNRGELQKLKAIGRSDRSDAMKVAVDELLRYDSPLPLFERWVLEDFEVDGIQLRRGGEVALLYASGNRDPRRYSDANRLDLTRRDNPLLTFGLGTHYCLGAPLARLELQVLFQVLLERLPRIELAATPEYNSGFVIRGLRSLPIAF